jgi:hypothetical protein
MEESIGVVCVVLYSSVGRADESQESPVNAVDDALMVGALLALVEVSTGGDREPSVSARYCWYTLGDTAAVKLLSPTIEGV